MAFWNKCSLDIMELMLPDVFQLKKFHTIVSSNILLLLWSNPHTNYKKKNFSIKKCFGNLAIAWNLRNLINAITYAFRFLVLDCFYILCSSSVLHCSAISISLKIFSIILCVYFKHSVETTFRHTAKVLHYKHIKNSSLL